MIILNIRQLTGSYTPGFSLGVVLSIAALVVTVIMFLQVMKIKTENEKKEDCVMKQ